MCPLKSLLPHGPNMSVYREFVDLSKTLQIASSLINHHHQTQFIKVYWRKFTFTTSSTKVTAGNSTNTPNHFILNLLLIIFLYLYELFLANAARSHKYWQMYEYFNFIDDGWGDGLFHLNNLSMKSLLFFSFLSRAQWLFFSLGVFAVKLFIYALQ